MMMIVVNSVLAVFKFRATYSIEIYYLNNYI